MTEESGLLIYCNKNARHYEKRKIKSLYSWLYVFKWNLAIGYVGDLLTYNLQKYTTLLRYLWFILWQFEHVSLIKSLSPYISLFLHENQLYTLQ